MEFNINYYAIIYPSDKGWDKIYDNLLSTYNDVGYCKSRISLQKTEDNGYKDQLWVIMNEHGNLFYNGSNYLSSTKITLIEE